MGARVTSKVVDIDKGVRALLRRMKSRRMGLTVGVHGDAGGNLASIATYNHEGTSRIPARPWLRQWFDKNLGANSDLVYNRFALVVLDKIPSLEAALHQCGAKFVAGAQAEIVAGDFAPNAQSTIDRKGSSAPLIDRGLLKSAHTYKLTQRNT